MFDASPELLEATRPFLPHFRFLIDDLAEVSLDALSSRVLSTLTRLVQMALWSARSFERLQEAAPRMRELSATLPRDERSRALLAQLYVYLLRAVQTEVAVDDVRTILLEVAGPQGREDVMNAAEQLIEQGRVEGRQEGRELGREEGLRTAIATALAARAVPLSEVGRARIEACTDAAVLTGWLARAVTSSSETEIFIGLDSPEAAPARDVGGPA